MENVPPKRPGATIELTFIVTGRLRWYRRRPPFHLLTHVVAFPSPSLAQSLLILGMSGWPRRSKRWASSYATDASVKGSVILAGSGTSVLSGSSIQAGAQGRHPEA